MSGPDFATVESNGGFLYSPSGNAISNSITGGYNVAEAVGEDEIAFASTQLDIDATQVDADGYVHLNITIQSNT